MRKLMLSALLGLGAFGATADSNQAKASWLSEVLNNSQIQVNIGSQYPSYPAAPVYAPTPAYPVYRPVPAYTPPAINYYPAPVYTPAPVVRVPVYRPAPVYVPQPQHVNYGPNRYEHDRHDWRDGRNDHDWRR